MKSKIKAVILAAFILILGGAYEGQTIQKIEGGLLTSGPNNRAYTGLNSCEGLNRAVQNELKRREITKRAVQDAFKYTQSTHEETIYSRNRAYTDEYSGLYLGSFKITNYTAGFESTGKRPGDKGYGITATGATVKDNHTIAADWRVLPPGTKVKIDGYAPIFTVEDKGGAVKGKHIDVYVNDLETAIKWGIKYKEIRVIEWGAEYDS